MLGGKQPDGVVGICGSSERPRGPGVPAVVESVHRNPKLCGVGRGNTTPGDSSSGSDADGQHLFRDALRRAGTERESGCLYVVHSGWDRAGKLEQVGRHAEGQRRLTFRS